MSKKSTLEQIHRSWFSDLIKETYYYCHHSLCVEILIFFTGKFQNSPIAGGGHLSILGENSPMGYENAEIIRLLKLAKNEPELEERKRIYQQIMPLYTADIPMTILFPEVSVLIAHKKIRGLEEYWDPTWFMEYLWIEEE